MYERMLNKQAAPTPEEMTAYCGAAGEWFTSLNAWLTENYETEQQLSFPYGNKYGWCIAHRKKKKLICNCFAEDNAFTVMMRLSDKQYQAVYEGLSEYSRQKIDNKYPCGDGGWIQYRIISKEQFEDIKILLAAKM